MDASMEGLLETTLIKSFEVCIQLKALLQCSSSIF